MKTTKTYYCYYLSNKGIIAEKVNEEDFFNVSYGFIVEENDLTDYSRLVPSELRHHKQYKVYYYKFGRPEKVLIDQFEFNQEIIFDEYCQKHPTLGGYILTNSLTFNLSWYNPYDKKDLSIKLYTELHYNPGVLGLYSIYFIYIYFTYHDCETWGRDCKRDCNFLWSILNSNAELFDTGGSQINLSNFNYGEFARGLIRLYNEFEVAIDDYKFMKEFYNSNIKSALSILENERRRLLLRTNNFQLL